MPWFHRSHNSPNHHLQAPALPEWSASGSRSYADGLYSDAPEHEYEDANVFCATVPVNPPRLLPSETIQSIREYGAACWGLEQPRLSRFHGTIRTGMDGNETGGSSGQLGNNPGLITVSTAPNCGDTCIFSNLPIIGGLYQFPPGQKGVYYEIKVDRMDGTVAIGATLILFIVTVL
jgi:hypothetical protein